ncbi:30S ribosomal protein S13 [Candidatus Roizmanbacteria bacterium RIFOXYB2_FULL_41_10]|uniref:Small ribosomal subunit protein uS13 n=1 Tax=Candidatus Roizmanbacteria bacterium RIFOXYA1_FULL_41_12 TaxID=1802082 RepID=A0A1F7K998_9BACT|nr:MAG: 30S ribosomal protein S13 [Candidatus Roizmanbacteria bacterium RIFOXYA1_FULL_41_12]OGK67857.1 MAG: 30S ribosomal protein S13 [Candidatus Roizmanbacteria bacterium RIFOXYB1_FULL_41_27]OGK68219.1 MAG: 30S ribosomal protein S13 [Candidatus Roizmanbacteria bacterium RIFOXYA2_FULL_41_8]OGK69220.1 MAG: 30S ribosomal protein S13 [Candidatus Roizmanbacteria bacterium RIFOXYB2_FULL_41_10]OGK72032.1 MAG: 30S ribosomal protein S13 [Candidatus Roizmanbacteria bacterium RIFOXYC1_FULL_41_16]OGK7468
MARLFGINLTDKDKISFALTGIYGIGFPRAKQILTLLKIDITKRVKDLTEAEIKQIQDYVEKQFKVEGDLRLEINENIKRLKEIGSYRGIRHLRGLPCRGQRTRSNARTRKGKKRTIGALSKEAWAKIDQVTQQKQVK